ncbi:hypothetical protein LQ953_05520 [Sphingomonas sp. IC-56]|uniref:hypothetical protein n=1 Tax=Sphingomonas sp. IC-56 TaxID=2898529 RepID=UPI001E46A76B|nr:hypothetical protein [Sphingomonas sp. IC-56]MCD2323472.1 hypothetical protein [Sphingomonas sp. IC-56]
MPEINAEESDEALGISGLGGRQPRDQPDQPVCLDVARDPFEGLVGDALPVIVAVGRRPEDHRYLEGQLGISEDRCANAIEAGISRPEDALHALGRDEVRLGEREEQRLDLAAQQRADQVPVRIWEIPHDLAQDRIQYQTALACA